MTTEIKELHPSEDIVSDNRYVIVDVRTRAERLSDSGFIPTAHHIVLTDIQEDAKAAMAPVHAARGVDPEKDMDVPLLLHCRSGRRSYRAAEALAAAGYLDLTNLAGGILEWVSDGLPVARAPALDAGSDAASGGAGGDAGSTLGLREYVAMMEECFLDSLGTARADEAVAADELRRLFREAFESAGSDVDRPRKADMEPVLRELGKRARGRHKAFADVARHSEEFLALLVRVRGD